MSNHEEKKNSSMMWIMLICCSLPLVILFVVGRQTFSGQYPWLIFVGAMMVGHLWMMFRGHGHESSNKQHQDGTETKQSSPENTPPTGEKKGEFGHSCCR